MPLQIIEKPCDESICAVWHIVEDISYFLAKVNIKTCPGFEQIHHPAKQLQWLASRLLVKELIENYFKLPFEGLYNDSNGKPWLQNHKYNISISNSHKIATAIIHRNAPVGIDVELIKPKILLIANKFLTPSERTLTSESKYLNTLAWCCKETLYKIHGTGNISLKDHIRLSPFKGSRILGTLEAKLLTQTVQTFQLKYFTIKDYMLVYNYYP